MGLTPEMFLREFFYPERGKKQASDGYLFLEEKAKEFIANLGVLLHDLKVQMALSVKADQ